MSCLSSSPRNLFIDYQNVSKLYSKLGFPMYPNVSQGASWRSCPWKGRSSRQLVREAAVSWQRLPGNRFGIKLQAIKETTTCNDNNNKKETNMKISQTAYCSPSNPCPRAGEHCRSYPPRHRFPGEFSSVFPFSQIILFLATFFRLWGTFLGPVRAYNPFLCGWTQRLVHWSSYNSNPTALHYSYTGTVFASQFLKM